MKNEKRKSIILPVIAVVSLGVVFLGVVLGQSSRRAPVVEDDPLPRQIYATARGLCQRSLKSPATAKFYSTQDDRDSWSAATRLEGMEKPYWLAEGRVDSQNEYGALLRKDWAAVVEERGQTVQLIWLKVGTSETGKLPTK